MTTLRSTAPDRIPERGTFRYTADLKKEDGTALLAADLAALTLTVYNLDTAQTIINSISATNILNTGRGSIDANGKLTVVLADADLALVDSTAASEQHIMLIQGTYAGGARPTRHEVLHVVQNMAKV